MERFIETILGAPLRHRLVDRAALFDGYTGAAAAPRPPAARSSAGSPGARRMMRKPIRVMPMKVGIINSKRCTK